jgi:hypothetical protein
LDRRVTDPPAQPPSRSEIREHLAAKLNSALRRTGMYGGEGALIMVFDHVAFTDGLGTGWWERQRAAWQARGAFSPIGPKGAFQHQVPGDVGSAVSSLYAESVHEHGWLALDRALAQAEYDALRTSVPAWITEDRTYTDVLDTYGPPSVLFGGSLPRYPKTLGYFTAQPSDPAVFFHLWNGVEPGTEPAWPPQYDEAILLATRQGTGPFHDSFAFTPHGRRLRPAPHRARGAHHGGNGHERGSLRLPPNAPDASGS